MRSRARGKLHDLYADFKVVSSKVACGGLEVPE